MINMKDVFWLAGLLEGEGCFKSSGNGVSIILGMTCRDVVERAARLLGANIQRPRQSTPPGHKDMVYCQVNANAAAGWMMTLYPLMGRRRKEAIEKALTKWKTLPGKGHHIIELSGRRFGRWTVLRREPRAGVRYTAWLCRCDCGAERTLIGHTLRTGSSQSCGCGRKSIAKQQRRSEAPQ